ncbi:phosphonate C-P lyase system protein PhnL [Rhodospirillaceae bacterium SYSU D60014]|uniref:phosphonate C-P lyase system protein PhnL n=1 Tax=Virgifigura deserti TaxID=2268457 RepID=UPI000E660745
MRNPVLEIHDLAKTFRLHVQGGIEIPVFDGIDLALHPGECLALVGASGAGKSTLMRSIYANYHANGGRILVQHRGTVVDMVGAEPRTILDIRRRTMGYVSQFLRVVPRVATEEIVAEPLRMTGVEAAAATDRARALLARLAIPERLWSLAPATFSGGEQQRVNIARGFIAGYPILLLDEPTASLDAANRRIVIELILEAKARGTAVIGIFHDREVRDAIADRLFDLKPGELAA